jgi:NAD(P)-dependent dehydrogenase (short-subunit alcohol dehydrogenase family)
MVSSDSNDKVALVTGANKGLGFEMSSQIAPQGLTAIVAARKLEATEAVATKLRNEGLKAEAIARTGSRYRNLVGNGSVS